MKKISLLLILLLLISTGCASSRPTEEDRALYSKAIANIQKATALHTDINLTIDAYSNGKKDAEESVQFLISFIDSELLSDDLSTKALIVSLADEPLYKMTFNFKGDHVYLDFMGTKIKQPVEDAEMLAGVDMESLLGYSNLPLIFDDSEDTLAAMAVSRSDDSIEFKLKTTKILETIMNTFLTEQMEDEFKVKNPQFSIIVSNEGVLTGVSASIEVIEASDPSGSMVIDIIVDFVGTNDEVEFVTPDWDSYRDASTLLT